MTDDQEKTVRELAKTTHWLYQQTVNTATNINLIAYLIVFIFIAVIVHVWHHW